MKFESQSPWEILGVSDQATEKDVKRAYAALIKQFRPDSDPENFQRINSAYEFLTQWIKTRASQTTPGPRSHNPPHGEKTPHAVPPAEIPKPALPVRGPALPSEFERLEQTLIEEVRRHHGTPEEDWRSAAGSQTALWQAFDEFRQFALRTSGAMEKWELSLRRIFGGDVEVIAPFFRPADIVMLLERDLPDLPLCLIDFWQARRDFHNLFQTAQILLHSKDGTSAALAPAMARLASSLAFANPVTAEHLVNAAFKRLPSNRRDCVLGDAEKKVAAGKYFAPLPPADRQFWEARLYPCPADATTDWSIDAILPAWRTLQSKFPSDWPGYAFLSVAVPKSVWEQLKGIQPANQPPLTPPASRERLWNLWQRPPIKYLKWLRGFFADWRFLFWGVFLLVVIGRQFTKETKPPPKSAAHRIVSAHRTAQLDLAAEILKMPHSNAAERQATAEKLIQVHQLSPLLDQLRQMPADHEFATDGNFLSALEKAPTGFALWVTVLSHPEFSTTQHENLRRYALGICVQQARADDIIPWMAELFPHDPSLRESYQRETYIMMHTREALKCDTWKAIQRILGPEYTPAGRDQKIPPPYQKPPGESRA